MEILDRYLYEVEKYLGKKGKDEVLNDIKSSVMVLTDEKTSKGTAEAEALRASLVEMGSPLDLARKYDPGLGYIIGPKLFKLYRIIVGFSILGISIGFATTMIIQLSFDPGMNVGLAIMRLLGQIMTAALSAIGAVTIVFYIIQKYIPQDAFSDEAWNPDNLPELPKKAEIISRTGRIIGIIAMVIFIFIFNFYPDMIGVFYKVDSGPYVFESLLTAENMGPYLIILNPLWFLAVVVNVYVLIKGKRTLKPKILESVALIGVFATLWTMFGDSGIMESAGEWAIPFTASLRMGFAAVVIVFVVDIIRYLIQYNRAA